MLIMPAQNMSAAPGAATPKPSLASRVAAAQTAGAPHTPEVSAVVAPQPPPVAGITEELPPAEPVVETKPEAGAPKPGTRRPRKRKDETVEQHAARVAAHEASRVMGAAVPDAAGAVFSESVAVPASSEIGQVIISDGTPCDPQGLDLETLIQEIQSRGFKVQLTTA